MSLKKRSDYSSGSRMNSRQAIRPAAELIAVWVIYPVKLKGRKWGSAENGATQFPVNVAKMEGAKFTSFAKLNKKKVKSTTISVICFFYNSCIVTVLTRYFTITISIANCNKPW